MHHATHFRIAVTFERETQKYTLTPHTHDTRTHARTRTYPPYYALFRSTRNLRESGPHPRLPKLDWKGQNVSPHEKAHGMDGTVPPTLTRQPFGLYAATPSASLAPSGLLFRRALPNGRSSDARPFLFRTYDRRHFAARHRGNTLSRYTSLHFLTRCIHHQRDTT